jgi:hypothetical protein
MKINYTNPHLSNPQVSSELNKYFRETIPQKYVEELEKSQLN